jgi:hypothetical protein
MKDSDREFLEWLREKELQQCQQEPPPPAPPPRTIHYTELPEDTSQRPCATEWNYYRREVGRLLAEGHEGKWVLIKGEEIIGIWDSRDEAEGMALKRYLMQDVLIRQILSREPLLRGPTFWQLWPS